MDIRKYRFQPNMSTSSKVFIDKKRKSQSRRKLKEDLRKIKDVQFLVTKVTQICYNINVI